MASGISTIVRDFLEAAAGIEKKPDPILISGGLLGVRPTLSLHFVSCSGEYRQCSFDHIVTCGQ